MKDGLIRSFMLTNHPSFTSPGEFTMRRSVVPSIAFMTVVATLGIAGAFARGADSDRSSDFAAAAPDGSCAGLPSHDRSEERRVGKEC